MKGKDGLGGKPRVTLVTGVAFSFSSMRGKMTLHIALLVKPPTAYMTLKRLFLGMRQKMALHSRRVPKDLPADATAIIGA